MSQKLKSGNQSKFPLLKLKPKRERSVLNRHPWLFSGAVIEYKDIAADGDIVAIVANDGTILAYGFYSSYGSIICKIFEFVNNQESHQNFDESYWLHKLTKAYNFREKFHKPDTTNIYRLINSEGDHLPGLIVDIYNNCAVIQLRNFGIEKLSNLLKKFLSDKLELDHIYLQGDNENETKKNEIHSKGKWLKGEIDSVNCIENNMQFTIEPSKGQKTGFFIDQRDNRYYTRSIVQKKRVLNAFCYTGGFSVAALYGKAESITSVDISKNAIELCNSNFEKNINPELNSVHQSVIQDCFEYLRQIEKNEFNCMILDPPAFTKHLSAVDRAARGYKDLNLKAMNKIESGGILLTFSCSQHISPQLFRQIVYSAAADSGRSVKLIKQMGAPADHPIDLFHPEGEYLKGLALVID